MEPDIIKVLMRKITTFLKNWLELQRETFPSIDGIFLLDDVIGFMGAAEFTQFGLPYFKELYDTNVTIKFLHNDANCRESAPLLTEIGVNLFNMEFDISLRELQNLTEHKVTLLGNIPPRDVLANGSVDDVIKVKKGLLDSLEDKSRIILSCGGGMPPGVTSENLSAFIQTTKNH